MIPAALWMTGRNPKRTLSNTFTLRTTLRDWQEDKIGHREVWRLSQIDTSDNIHEAVHQSDAYSPPLYGL